MINIFVHLMDDYGLFHRSPMLKALANNLKGKAIVICINPIKALRIRELFSKKSISDKLKMKTIVENNLIVVNPTTNLHHFIFKLPIIGNIFYRQIIKKALIRSFPDKSIFANRSICWLYRPEQIYAAGIFNSGKVIYECYDEYNYDPKTGKYLKRAADYDSKLLQIAKIVFVTSNELYNARKGRHMKVFEMRNGVDYALFGADIKKNTSNLLRGIPKPIIAYPGNLSDFVDLDLIEKTASHYKDSSIVLFGRVSGDTKIDGLLSRNKNIYYLGHKPQHEMAQISKEFDVVIMPFKKNIYLEASNPLIMWEQLAARNIIVSTLFSESIKKYEDIMFIAGNDNEFIDCIARALMPNKERREKGVAIAKKNAWNNITKEYVYYLQKEGLVC